MTVVEKVRETIDTWRGLNLAEGPRPTVRYVGQGEPQPAPRPATAAPVALETLKAASARLTEAAALVRARIAADPNAIQQEAVSFSASNASRREFAADLQQTLDEALAGEPLTILQSRDLARARRALSAVRPGMDSEGAIEIIGRRILDAEQSAASERFQKTHAPLLAKGKRKVADKLLALTAAIKDYEGLAAGANSACSPVHTPNFPVLRGLTDALKSIYQQVKNAKSADDLL